MTHDELLAKIDKLTDEDFGVILGPALRAVVELHKKISWHSGCPQCGYYEYPCPTIKAIEKELG